MPIEPLMHVVGQLRRAALADGGLTDGQLLDAYLADRDEAAFECLVWRHGPAVLGACRRLLGNQADAEDAFQATFLVLVRKGHVVRPRGAVGGWLYGVACNVARKARAAAARRRAKELMAVRPPAAEPSEPDVRPLVDDEIGRLPERYRAPVVLCELEGQAIADAARHLGCPPGTVASRLARGRALLARRLAHRGLSLAGLAAAAVSAESVAGVLQAIRQRGTAASRLADAAAVGISWTGFKATAATVVVCASLLLAGGLAYRMAASERGETPTADPPPKPAAPPAAPSNAEPPSLIGRWRIAGERAYRVLEFREQPGQGLLIAEKANHNADWFSWKVDDKKSPKEIDVFARVEGASFPNRGIYTFEGERLVIYFGTPLVYQGDPGKHTRPTSFDVEGKTGERFMVLEREMLAWGEPRPDGLQYGLLAEPNGRTVARVGEGVAFRVYVRNTTNKGVDLTVTRASDTLPGWPVQVRDEKWNAIPVTNPAPPPGFLPESAFLRKRLLDYGVAEVGTIRLTFLTPDEVQRERRPVHLVPVTPGTYSIHLGSEKGNWGGAGPTGVVKLKIDEPVAWGREVNGLQFGLALGKGQSSRIHVGERARFRVFARNRSDREVAVGTLQVLHLPMYAEPAVTADGTSLDVRFVRGPQVNPPPASRRIGPREVVELPGEFVLPFLPHPAAGETHVVARPGQWTVAVPKLDTWFAGSGYGTGTLKIEVVPGDLDHVDGQHIAWGPVADGLQFGLRPEKSSYRVGDMVQFSVHARNMSAADVTIMFPQLSAWFPNGRPMIRDADGNEVKALIASPRGPIGPQAGIKHTLKVGETTELGNAPWAFVAADDARHATVDHVIVKPGAYTFQYPDLHPGYRPPWPTGAAGLTFREALALNKQPNLDADGVAWGPVADGLQFGLRADKAEYTLGDTIQFDIRVRNMSDSPIQFGFPEVSALWPHGIPVVRDASGQVVAQPVATPGGRNPRPKVLWHVLAAGSTVDVATSSWMFPIPDSARPVGPGVYSFQYPDLNQPNKPAWPTGELWLTFRERATSKKPADADADGVSWGLVVEGVQFGMRFDPSDRRTAPLGYSLVLTLFARGADGANFDLPRPEFLNQLGIRPTIKDAAGREVKITTPPRDSLPQPRYQTFLLRTGVREELFKTEWPLVKDRREGNEAYFVVAPGEYTIRFDNLRDPRKEVLKPAATGELTFTVK